MNIDVKLNSDDSIMNQVYDLIKQKVLSAPEKYDRIIKKRASIYHKVCFALGFIPSSIILFLLVFVPVVRRIYGMTYVLFPSVCILLSYIVGNTFFCRKLGNLYQNILPEKKYAGYDSTNHKSIYKDDIEQFMSTSEILIGKNVDNLKNRREIAGLELKYGSYLKYEILVLLSMSLLVIFMDKFM